ncbi:helix-turn-helix transcriptional regulator [Sphingomonas sp. 4RDLI-65]|uniref:helix-turn-helix domain-containing protein n=1 Tax=Sphingomonas sp. 4RDLI-65 TaxID=3111641 RepID=UPI003C1DDA88
MTSLNADKPSDRLRLARERAGFSSAADAARAHRWSEGAYRHHENGTRNYPTKTAEDYARAYGVSASWLLGLTDRDWRSHAREIQSQLYTDAEAESVREFNEKVAKEFGIVVLDSTPLSELGDHRKTEMFNETFSLDVSIIEQIAPGRSTTPLTFKAIRVDTRVDAREIELGAVLIVDQTGPRIGRQGALMLYTYAGFAGVSEIFRHSDETVELLRTGAAGASIRIALKELKIWGQVVWIGQAPK